MANLSYGAHPPAGVSMQERLRLMVMTLHGMVDELVLLHLRAHTTVSNTGFTGVCERTGFIHPPGRPFQLQIRRPDHIKTAYEGPTFFATARLAAQVYDELAREYDAVPRERMKR